MIYDKIEGKMLREEPGARSPRGWDPGGPAYLVDILAVFREICGEKQFLLK
jgi:hypothetical protein